MIIFGVDPGTIFTGFGIITSDGIKLKYLDSGIVKPNPNEELSQKLKHIYLELEKKIQIHKPEVFCLETAFYGKNVQSAMKIGYVRGVAMLAATMNNLDCFEYSPREIKKAVVGNGSASKEQVQYMIKNILSFKKDKLKFDETDALAVSVCHSIKINSFVSSNKNWKAFIKQNPDRIVE
ncbi:MAG: crossover junction endodeoxyribonuclease RuvC [Ignavibacteriae bacterium]|nr:MAG: crossover junction endodeoxyribonuclease RuvC [Ignavibacteriota bacterium]